MEQLNKKFKNPTSEEIKSIKEKYIPGAKIELIKMYDNTHPVPSGTKGIVDFVDDIGTVHVRWETGSGLGLIIGLDEFKILEEDKSKIDYDVKELLGYFDEELESKIKEEESFIPVLNRLFYDYIQEHFKTTKIEKIISNKMLSIQKKLEDSFTQEQKDLFKKYDYYRDDLDCYSAKQGFVYGFCLDKQLKSEKNTKKS